LVALPGALRYPDTHFHSVLLGKKRKKRKKRMKRKRRERREKKKEKNKRTKKKSRWRWGRKGHHLGHIERRAVLLIID